LVLRGIDLADLDRAGHLAAAAAGVVADLVGLHRMPALSLPNTTIAVSEPLARAHASAWLRDS